MREKTKQCLALCALLGWMGVLFWFSHQSGVESSELSDSVAKWISNGLFNMESLTYLVRKGAHFGVYALLGALACGWLCQLARTRRHYGIAAALVGICYAASDEFHQYFIPGRSASVWDVLLDSAGAAAGIGCFMLLRWLLRRRGEKV